MRGYLLHHAYTTQGARQRTAGRGVWIVAQRRHCARNSPRSRARRSPSRCRLARPTAPAHIYNDPKRHPFLEGRTYTPEPATVPELKQMMRALRSRSRRGRAGVDARNRQLASSIDSIRELGAGARGVAVIDDKTTEAALDDMHRGGVRGIRLSLGNQGATDPAAARQRLKTAGDRMKNRKGWSALISGSPATWDALRVDLAAFPVPIVIDHFGEPRVADGVGQPGFTAVLSLVKSGKAYVKLSNADTLTQSDMSDVTPYAKALIAANPQRAVFGTAWPHPSAGGVPGRKPTDLALHRQTDDGQVMNMLAVWAPDAAMRKTDPGGQCRTDCMGSRPTRSIAMCGRAFCSASRRRRVAQTRRIQGKVVDEQGAAVAGAAIEVTLMAPWPTRLCRAKQRSDMARHGRTRTATTSSRCRGAGEYVVTATKDGVGSDQTKVAVQQSGLVTANLTLWKIPAATSLGRSAARAPPIGALSAVALAAAADAGSGSIVRVAGGGSPAHAWLRRYAGGRNRRLAAARSRSAVAGCQRARDISSKGQRRAHGAAGSGSAQRDQADLFHLRSPIHVR